MEACALNRTKGYVQLLVFWGDRRTGLTAEKPKLAAASFTSGLTFLLVNLLAS
jgi:hypothetical protein